MDGSTAPSGLKIPFGDLPSEFRFAADRLRRTAVAGFFAEIDFVRRDRLPGDEGMGLAVVAGKEGGGMVTALVAVDAFVVDEERTAGVLGKAMDGSGHEPSIRESGGLLSPRRESRGSGRRNFPKRWAGAVTRNFAPRAEFDGWS